jgi:hypothetical protein
MTNKIYQKITKKTLKKKKQEYYLIGPRFSPSFVVVINNKSIKVYKTINSNSNNIYNKKKILNFDNYVSLKKKSKIIVNKKEIFFLPKFYKIFIGYDVNPENIYIKNKNFGKGNCLLIYDGIDYYCIYGNNITKIDTKNIKGKVIGFIAPIFNSEEANPQILTESHIYSWCSFSNNEIYELPIPRQKKKIHIIKLLYKAKNPFDISKKYYKDIETLYGDYKFPYYCAMSDTKLNETILYSIN